MAVDSVFPVIAAPSSMSRASIVQQLARRRAITHADAVPFGPATAGEQRALDALLKAGVVIKVGQGTFYVDEKAVDAVRHRRLRALRVAALAAILTGVVAIGIAAVR